jgi:hypothetical protein
MEYETLIFSEADLLAYKVEPSFDFSIFTDVEELLYVAEAEELATTEEASSVADIVVSDVVLEEGGTTDILLDNDFLEAEQAFQALMALDGIII